MMLEPVPDGPRSFEAVLYPNPPIGTKAFIGLMAGLSAISAAVGVGFIAAGAWPVTGFFGLDLLLLGLAFRTCRRRARRSEQISLDPSGLRVRSLDPHGHAREWRFEPYWVRVSIDDPPRRDSLLTLSAHGRQLRIGSFLTLEERQGLARALQDALRPYR
jgi:uncharacterized membrane protein